MFTVTEFSTKKALNKALKEHKVNTLFCVGNDSKTVKGEKYGYTTAIMYLLPDNVTCPASKMAKCAEGCLNTAGHGQKTMVQKSRENKTNLFHNNKPLFFSAIISKLESLHKKHGDSLVVRLNGTSDIAFESIPFSYKGVEYNNIFEYFSDVQFYDYTKRISRLSGNLPSNYDVTLSYSGANVNYAKNCIEALSNNKTRLAVVFRDILPEVYKGFPVINGDDTDLRFLDSHNVVVGLKAKAKAKKDDSGFVQDVKENLIISA